MPIIHRQDPAIENLGMQKPHACDGCGEKFTTPTGVVTFFHTLELWFCGDCATSFGAKMLAEGAIVNFQKTQLQVDLIREIETLNS